MPPSFGADSGLTRAAQHVAVGIHEELESQNALLENFELDVEETGTRLAAANQRVRRVLAQSRAAGFWPCSCACVAGVALVVIVVILAVRAAKIAAIFSGLG